MGPGADNSVAVPGANVDEGELDEEPEAEESDEGAEWDGRGACLAPNEEIEDEENREKKARNENASLFEMQSVLISPKGLTEEWDTWTYH